MRNIRYWPVHDWLPWILLVVFIALSVVVVMATISENRAWERFAQEHACTIVAKKEGSLSTGVAPIIGGNGGVAITTSSTSPQVAYLCDDGITYWRNE